MHSGIIQTLLTRLAPLQGQLPPLYLVGGQVRDFLLGRPAADIDLVCARAEDTARRIARKWNASLVPFHKKGRQTCFRVVFGNDPGDTLDVTSFQGATLAADLSRRDFTINAMALEIGPNGPGRIIDLFGGRKDLQSSQVRMTSDVVFAADPIRVLRSFRFCAQLGFTLDSATQQRLQEQSGLLSQAAPERISAELVKLFASPVCCPVVRQMDQAGVLEILFPELSSLKGCKQNEYHHLDVWEHSLEAFKHMEDILERLPEVFPNSWKGLQELLETHQHRAVLKLGVLFHDLGKPDAQGLNPKTGRITFYGHDRAGVGSVDSLARRLRLSIRNRDLLRLLVAEHIHVYALSRPGVKKSTRMRFFRTYRDMGLLCILLGLADIEARRGPAAGPDERSRYQEWAAQAVDQYFRTDWNPEKHTPLITGKDLIRLGLEPGPVIGRILEQVQEAEDDGLIQTRKQALDLAEKMHRGKDSH
ncbi:MAG: HD domain-containing protein [Desulfohalobiaceae bacterium]|nr:HD domain-containing protein [Desulfohalobiaceae bacterium]